MSDPIFSGGANGLRQEKQIGRAVAAAGIVGGKELPIRLPKVSADQGKCGEEKRTQLSFSEALLYSWLLMWLASMFKDNQSDGDCGCGGIPAPPLLILLLWFRDVNAGLSKPSQGCPVFVSGRFSQTGTEMWATSEHIQEAQGRGSFKRLTWLGKPERPPRPKLSEKLECSSKGAAALEYASRFGMASSQCDEYPFNSTMEGNPVFYTDLVHPWSLKLVPASHNRSQGGTINAFYTACGVRKFQLFEVRAEPEGATKSHGLNGQGKQCYPGTTAP